MSGKLSIRRQELPPVQRKVGSPHFSGGNLYLCGYRVHGTGCSPLHQIDSFDLGNLASNEFHKLIDRGFVETLKISSGE